MKTHRQRHERLAGLAIGVVAMLAMAGCSDKNGARIVEYDVRPDSLGETGPGSDVEVSGDWLRPPDFVADHRQSDGESPDAQGPCPGCFGWPCTQNDQCLSDYCVEGPEQNVCSQTCQTECPAGWNCVQAQTRPDLVYVCLPIHAMLCRPCTAHADCRQLSGNTQDYCVPYGPAEGSFCGGACSDKVVCPAGFECRTVDIPDVGPVDQCLPVAGQCSCAPKYVGSEAYTACQLENEFGRCTGQRRCTAAGLSDCDAAPAATEDCDGQDNDCDGQTDEDLTGSPCDTDSPYGQCEGTLSCTAGDAQCDGPLAMTDVCDGMDNDCDALTDEDFDDLDDDGLADCVDDDLDGDGLPNDQDNCPRLANADQYDHDFDTIGDVCDPDDDNDQTVDEQDCAPFDGDIHPGAVEVCNGEDDDCDQVVDEAFGDLDGDGIADCVDPDADGDAVDDVGDNCPVTFNPGQLDADGDGVGDACEEDTDGDLDPDVSDCEPLDPAVHHGADEQCNDLDDNCNDIADEGFADTDGDGLPDCIDPDDDNDGVADEQDNCPLRDNGTQTDTDDDGQGNACDADDDNDGWDDGDDCAPLNAQTYPEAPEVCDGRDNDCDTQVDEAGAAGCTVLYYNGDGDGFGLALLSQCLCMPAAPFTALQAGDCDDANPQVFPGATELCNNRDDDCDTTLDEAGALGCATWYGDADGDGYGGDQTACLCAAAVGYANRGGDCDEQDAQINPGRAELCDGLDNDCDGQTDETYSDIDQDELADCMDDDDDGDGIPDDGDGSGTAGDAPCTGGQVEACDDNCPMTANADQADLDGDGRGDLCAHDTDGDGDPNATDCAPSDPDIHHGAQEQCNNVDDNCNARIDEGFADADGDGLANCVDDDDDNDEIVDGEDNCPLAANQSQGDNDDDGFGDACDDDDDADGWVDNADCAPLDDAVHPGALESCDGVDNDCDQQVDEAGAVGCATYYYNADGDGFGLALATQCLCLAVPPFSANQAGDCDDTNPQVFPGATEFCNGRDDDCDQQVDEANAIGCTTMYADTDGDGYGGGQTACLCAVMAGFAVRGGDCDESEVTVNPGVDESCNGLDDDCNGETDEGFPDVDDDGLANCVDDDDDGDTVADESDNCPNQPNPLQQDSDGDGIGDACETDTDGDGDLDAADCAPLDPEVHHGATETCNLTDDNCNGQIDEWVQTTFYLDNDGDHYGASYNTVQACQAPAGYVAQGGDCNDFNATIGPGAPERCDEIDNDCDGQQDEGMPLTTIYVDLDGDGFGAAGTPGIQDCLYDLNGDGTGETPPTGYSLSHDDCNDSNATVYPGAAERCDGVLNNCNLTVKDLQCPALCAGNWPVYLGATSGYPAVAQLDQDNELEVVVVGASQAKAINHDGSALWNASVSVSYSHPLLADLNGDSTVDVVVNEHGGRITVLNGVNGAVLATYQTGTSSGYYDGAAFDVDGDGVTDLVTNGSAPYKILLLNSDLTVKQTVSLNVTAPAYFFVAPALIADLDGNGTAEVGLGTGHWGCTAGSNCLGYFYVFNAAGSLWADPLTQFVVPFASSGYAGEGDFPTFADFDADGTAEVYQYFSNKTGAGRGMVWSVDGQQHALSGTLATTQPLLAPLQADGSLTADGRLSQAGGAVVDFDGDGRFEVFKFAGGGLSAYRGSTLLDGYPVMVPGSYSPVAADLNRDGRLDLVYLGGSNASVNCYTLGEGSYNDLRVLNFGSVAGMQRNAYTTHGFDPLEPNDRRNQPFTPATSTAPLTDSRAFSLKPFRDVYTSGGGWTHKVWSMLATPGDRDYFALSGTIIALTLQRTSSPFDPDLYLHMFKQVSGAWQYITTWSSTAVGNDSLTCHSTTPCPDVANNGVNKLFIIEVRGKSSDADAGPWPYVLTTSWAQ